MNYFFSSTKFKQNLVLGAAASAILSPFFSANFGQLLERIAYGSLSVLSVAVVADAAKSKNSDLDILTYDLFKIPQKLLKGNNNKGKSAIQSFIDVKKVTPITPVTIQQEEKDEDDRVEKTPSSIFMVFKQDAYIRLRRIPADQNVKGSKPTHAVIVYYHEKGKFLNQDQFFIDGTNGNVLKLLQNFAKDQPFEVKKGYTPIYCLSHAHENKRMKVSTLKVVK